MRIDGVEQPEVCNVRHPKIGQSAAALTPAARQRCASRGQNLHEPAYDPDEVCTRGNVQEWRDEGWLQLKIAGGAPYDLGNRQEAVALECVGIREEPKHFPCNLDRLFRETAVLVPA